MAPHQFRATRKHEGGGSLTAVYKDAHPDAKRFLERAFSQSDAAFLQTMRAGERP
jgi:hypothetical protein